MGWGVKNEGYLNSTLGLPGWHSAGEEMVVARNILLAEKTMAHIHCQHMSAAGSIRLLREAKSRGVPISGEACPHHFTLTDATIAGSEKFWAEDGKGVNYPGDGERPAWPEFDTNFKMNPPLRSAADREAVIEGLVDGTLEIISSDHAPHCDYEKEVEFANAPFGITGLENQLAVALMQLYHSGRMPLADVIARLTVAPARLIRSDCGTLSVGAPADVTVFDHDAEWVFSREYTASKATNNPFFDWTLKGRPVMTIVGGEIVWQ